MNDLAESCTVTNESGLRPCGRAVLLAPYEPEIKKSMIVIPDSASERSAMIETRAVVIAIGPECWKDEQQPRASVGDKILIAKFAGAMVKGTADGVTYRMVNDRDIYCRIEVENA